MNHDELTHARGRERSAQRGRCAYRLPFPGDGTVGDAAHIHSPFEAQGMNTGLQDAWNLAWILAAVINGFSPVSLLESFEAELAASLDDPASRLATGSATACERSSAMPSCS